MNKIAVIDVIHQDIGLNILFPEADYYTIINQLDKSNSLNKYGIKIRNDIENITDKKYDYLFIIISLYDTVEETPFWCEFNKNLRNILNNIILKKVNENNFKKVFIFDNYDYDYDPNDYVKNDKIDLYFKRYYNKTKEYKSNVIPFPFIMFGQRSMIELMDNKKRLSDNAINRIYFTGNIFVHNNDYLKYYRERATIYSGIKDRIYNSGHCDHNIFMNNINTSKFCLDLNGTGDPNMRTFEILSQGSLRISQYNDLKWCFDDNFCEETIFKDADDFHNKINRLQDEILYNKCLQKQNELVEKYFNKEWLRKYIEGFM